MSKRGNKFDQRASVKHKARFRSSSQEVWLPVKPRKAVKATPGAVASGFHPTERTRQLNIEKYRAAGRRGKPFHLGGEPARSITATLGECANGFILAYLHEMGEVGGTDSEIREGFLALCAHCFDHLEESAR
jgi:hypothetical protein